MNLPSDVFDNILKALVKADSIAGDKRSVPRLGLRSGVEITPLFEHGPGRKEQVWIRDISKSGIGLLVKAALQVGQSFVVELDREDEPPAHLLCKVKRRKMIDGDLFVIGAVFVRHIDGEMPVLAVETRPVEIPEKPSAPSADSDEAIERIRSAILR